MGDEGRRILLMALLSLWALMWGYSFFAAFRTAIGETDVTGGTNRAAVFIGWQLAAAIPAFAAWAVGRPWPRGSGVRLVSRVPLQLATAMGAVILGLIVWALLAR